MKRAGTLLLLGLIALGPVALRAADPDPVSLLQAAEMAIEDGFHQLAQTRLAQVDATADAKQQIIEAGLLRAKSLLARSQFDDAMQILAPLGPQSREHGRALEHAFWLALVHANRGVPDQSLAILAGVEIPAGHAYEVPLRRLEARCRLAGGDLEPALDVLAGVNDELAWLEASAIAITGGATNRVGGLLQRFANADLEQEAARQGLVWLAAWRHQRGESGADLLLQRLLERPDLQPAPRRRALLQLVDVQTVTNVAAAVDTLLAAEALAPTPADRAAITVRRAQALLGLGEEEEGVALLQESIPVLTDLRLASSAQLFLAGHFYDQAEYLQAEKAYDAHLLAFTNSAARIRSLDGKAWSILRQDRSAEAVGVFQKVFDEAEDRKTKEQARFKIADALFQNKQYDEAAEEYRNFTRMVYDDPLQPQAIFQTGLCLMRGGRPRDARREFSHLARVYPESEFAEKAMIELAHIEENATHWDTAINLYDEYLAVYTGGAYRVEVVLNRGICSYRLEDFGRALENFNALLRDFPRHKLAEQADYMRGWCVYLQGDDPGAREIFESFIEAYPNSTKHEDTLFWLAERDFNLSEFKQAEDRFVDLGSRFPEGRLCGQAWYWAGRSAAEQKEYTRARQHYTTMIKSRPDSPRVPEALYGQGDALTILGLFPDAIAVFQQLIEQHPNSYLVPSTWNRVGDCQSAQPDEGEDPYRDAITSYEAALQARGLSPALRIQVEYRLGRLHQNRKETEVAIERFTSAVYTWLEQRERMEKGSEVWFTQAAYEAAKLLEDQDEYDKAVSLYKRIVQLGGPEAREAEKRIQKLRLERLIPFTP